MSSPTTTGLDPKVVIENKIRLYASRKRPCVPNIATIQFLKARIHLCEQLHYVTFQDTLERQWFFTYFLSQTHNGSWYISHGGGSPHEPDDLPEMLSQPLPWLRLTSGSIGGTFHAGGEVIDKGFDIVRVCLVSQSGSILEDTVEDGLVLFQGTSMVITPMQAELYNRANEIINRQMVFTSPLFSSVVNGEKAQGL